MRMEKKRNSIIGEERKRRKSNEEGRGGKMAGRSQHVHSK